MRRREGAGCGFWTLRAPTPPLLPGVEQPSPWPGSNAGAHPEIKHKNTHTTVAYKGKSISWGVGNVFGLKALKTQELSLHVKRQRLN